MLVIGTGALAAALLDALSSAGIGALSAVAATSDGDAPDVPGDPALVRHPADRFEPGRSFGLLLDVDVVADASDSAATRYLANDAAAIRGIPMVWGSTTADRGMVGTAWEERGIDYRDLVPEGSTEDPGPGTAPGLAGAVAAIMTEEVVTVLTGGGDPLLGRVAVYEPGTGTVTERAYRRDPGTPRPGSIEERTAMHDHDDARSVSPEQLAAELGRDDAPLLLDVREPWEAAVVTLPGAALIPLGDLRQRAAELDPSVPVVIYCHHGVRSARALELLEQAGFTRARHLTGGIAAWADKVDPSLPRY